MLLMGGEVYDDPMQLIASLPERSLLSDFVESMHPVTEAVSMVGLLVAGLLMSMSLPCYEQATVIFRRYFEAFGSVYEAERMGVGLGQ